MATDNPTGTGTAVALTIPTHHLAFLRHAFTACRDGLLADLADHPDRLREPERSRQEADAYGRLLKALDNRSIVPDADVRRALMTLADAVDDGNDYCRVVTEHRALCGLHGQLVQLDRDR